MGEEAAVDMPLLVAIDTLSLCCHDIYRSLSITFSVLPCLHFKFDVLKANSLVLCIVHSHKFIIIPHFCTRQPLDFNGV